MLLLIRTLILSIATIVWGLAQGDQTKPELEELFYALQQSDDLVEITELQNQVWSHWYQLPKQSEQLQPIFDQGLQALHFGQLGVAITHFSQTVEAAPTFAEGWNRRATAFFMVGDYEASLTDIQQTLILEPRHFGALGGLSKIFENTQQYDQAIQAEKLLLKIMPKNTLIQERIKRLKTKSREAGI
jgi:tetratricopeptide (TPR) repeat protein